MLYSTPPLLRTTEPTLNWRTEPLSKKDNGVTAGPRWPCHTYKRARSSRPRPNYRHNWGWSSSCPFPTRFLNWHPVTDLTKPNSTELTRNYSLYVSNSPRDNQSPTTHTRVCPVWSTNSQDHNFLNHNNKPTQHSKQINLPPDGRAR